MSLLCVMHCVEHQTALFNLTLKSAYETGSVAGHTLNCVRHFVTPWTVVHQAPVSVEFSRQECWRVLPFSPPRDLPNPGIEPSSLESLALADRLPLALWFGCSIPLSLEFN